MPVARGPELPRRRRRQREDDFSFLLDGQWWLLVRGQDFEEELSLPALRKRVKRWAEDNHYGKAEGYGLDAAVEQLNPETGEGFVPSQESLGKDADEALAYGLNVRLKRESAAEDG